MSLHRRSATRLHFFLVATVLTAAASGGIDRAKPNILWVLAEDIAADDLPLYGNTICRTPNIDRFAAEGMRFDQAFTTAGLCSPSRTAMITGIYQMRLGGLNQRCQHLKGKGMGAEKFHASYTLPETLDVLPAYLRNAGYFTANGRITSESQFRAGKTDFNFVPRGKVFDGQSWEERKPGTPFFQQITIDTTHSPWPSDPERPIEPSATGSLHPIHPDDPLIQKELLTPA